MVSKSVVVGMVVVFLTGMVPASAQEQTRGPLAYLSERELACDTQKEMSRKAEEFGTKEKIELVNDHCSFLPPKTFVVLDVKDACPVPGSATFWTYPVLIVRNGQANGPLRYIAIEDDDD